MLTANGTHKVSSVHWDQLLHVEDFEMLVVAMKGFPGLIEPHQWPDESFQSWILVCRQPKTIQNVQSGPVNVF